MYRLFIILSLLLQLSLPCAHAGFMLVETADSTVHVFNLEDIVEITFGELSSLADDPVAFKKLETMLGSISPNPFSTNTDISYRVTAAAPVVIDILNVKGRIIRQLFRGRKPAGEHRVRWDCSTDVGNNAPAGAYLLRISVDGNELLSRLMLVK